MARQPWGEENNVHRSARLADDEHLHDHQVQREDAPNQYQPS